MAIRRSSLSTLRRLPWRDLALLGEAGAFLALASGLIALFPFRLVAATTGWGGRTPSPLARAAVRRRVRWAIRAWAARVPWRAVCLQESVTAQWMLRRRGIASRLCLGAWLDPARGLVAHAWVRDGDITVVGDDEPQQFAVLATYPSLDPDQN
jgi:hypothetical protein